MVRTLHGKIYYIIHIFYNFFIFFLKVLPKNVLFYFNMHFFSILVFQLPFLSCYVILNA